MEYIVYFQMYDTRVPNSCISKHVFIDMSDYIIV